MAKKAVLCGINNYKSQPDLRGCLNDVNNMYSLLTEFYRFNPFQIHQLLDNQVTKTTVQTEWKWLLEDAKPGDQLVFHFSGHGSYVPDTGANASDDLDAADGYDEITCLYDMDFYDPETYIRDDEWNQMLQQLPSEVRLTIVMDNCHSGTGTRMVAVQKNGDLKTIAIDAENSSTRSISQEYPKEEYKELLEDHQIVLSRFLPPPQEFQERLLTTARTRGLPEKTYPPLNYLLLAASQADQTAADAFIAGKFHGAFTYYLCQTLRQSPQIESQQLVDTVTQLLAPRFTQKPQHEGSAEDAFFNSNTSKTTPIFPEKPPMPSPNGLTPENQKLLIDAYLQLLETLSAPSIAPAIPKDETARQTGNHYLVYVHGISRHTPGYSDDWWKALQPHVGQMYGTGTLGSTRQEVLWSDLVNSRSVATNIEERKQLQREIELVLAERKYQEIAANTQGGQAARQASQEARSLERGGGLAIDDFLTYMTDSRMRQQIIDRFTKVVAPLLRDNNQVDIISHSWGTVVAYEGLRELESNPASQGRVSNLFSVGSALSLFPVRGYLREANKDGRRPAQVDRWINLDAKGDLVGGMLGDMFEITQEYLALEPTGCSRSLFGYNLSCAHSSYFSASNTNVNRNIFAKYIAI